MGLNPTGPRLELLWAIAKGEYSVSRDGAAVLQVWHHGILSTDGRLRARFHELIEAGLVRRVPIFANDLRPAVCTADGRAWLTEHGQAAR